MRLCGWQGSGRWGSWLRVSLRGGLRIGGMRSVLLRGLGAWGCPIAGGSCTLHGVQRWRGLVACRGARVGGVHRAKGRTAPINHGVTRRESRRGAGGCKVHDCERAAGGVLGRMVAVVARYQGCIGLEALTQEDRSTVRRRKTRISRRKSRAKGVYRQGPVAAAVNPGWGVLGRCGRGVISESHRGVRVRVEE